MGCKLGPNARGTIPGKTKTSRCFTDGSNYVWVEVSHRSFVASITHYSQNDCNHILSALAAEFDTDSIDEDHPSFWEDYEGEVMAIPMSDFIVMPHREGRNMTLKASFAFRI